MNGTIANTEHISTVVKANARRWLGSPKTARRCSTGRRRPPAERCAASGGISRIAMAPTATESAASARNGARHEKCAAIHSDSGTPATAASEKAAATIAVAAARRAYGTRSATIANVSPPSTPPKAPATMRAASSIG